MLRISGCQEDAIMLLLKPGPRSEFRIPITNLSSVKASCEFKILPGGMNSDMHTFFTKITIIKKSLFTLKMDYMRIGL